MNVNLLKYSNKKICVAVSGGSDSMALLHYVLHNGAQYNITLCAVNCDHSIRGEASKSDSAFVKKWCKKNGVPLISFVAEKGALTSEQSARNWRISCYQTALKAQILPSGERWDGADLIATAHHANDNAETLLFNLARGCALSGMTGICDGEILANGEKFGIIRPLINCSKNQIVEYILKNKMEYVVDETNLTCDYTRNKIRNEALPVLEAAVPGAVQSICRFSALAQRDEEYFLQEIERLELINFEKDAVIIQNSKSYALFSRAVVLALKTAYNIKDYTAEHIERLFDLQNEKVGNKFEFLHLCAYKEEGQIAVCKICEKILDEIPVKGFNSGIFAGEFIKIQPYKGEIYSRGELIFDADLLPENAVIRTRRKGDKFQKFGGGTKSLGDYFTDKKIPQRLRDKIPLIAAGSEVYAVLGVEICNKIKVLQNSKNVCKITFN